MNWQVKKLGEICEIERGGSPRPIDSFLTTSDDGINWIKIGDTKGITKYITHTEEKIKPEGVKRSRMVFEGDFILSNSMSFGRPYIMKTSGCIHDGWLVLRQPKIDQDYLYYVLSSDLVYNQFDRLAAGSTVRNLNISLVQGVDIPFPPLPEQKRIVSILDEAFEGIATAKVNAEQNCKNARAIFDSHLSAVFKNKRGLWSEKQLGSLAEIQSGGTPTVSNKEYWNGSIPWYSSGELNQTLTTTPERSITDSGLNASNAKLFPKGSLLIGMYDTAALKMSILDRDASFNQAIAGVKPNDAIDVEFIMHAINAEKSTLLLQRRGVRQKNLSLGKIKEILIPLPSRKEQQFAVSSLREVSDESNRLGSLYQRKLEVLDELKKSLLHKAFAGEL